MDNELLQIEYVPIRSIKPYGRNARSHSDKNVDAIAASIREFGFNDPIALWHGEIVAGHGRWMAAKKLKLKTVPVIRLDSLSDEQRRAYALAKGYSAVQDSRTGYNMILNRGCLTMSTTTKNPDGRSRW